MSVVGSASSTDIAFERATSRESTACLHCGLPVPEGRRDSYCCGGCRRVRELIREAGLDRYYELRTPQTAPPVRERPGGYAWLDRLLEETPTAHETRSGTRSLTLDLQGIHCAACVWLLQEIFRRWAGGVDIRINPSLGRVELVWDPARGEIVDYLREAERFGYRFGPARSAPVRRSSGLLWKLGICMAVALNAMMFSLSFYFGLARIDGPLYALFGWLNFSLGTIAVVVGGPLFFRGAWHGLRRGLVHLDLPISLGIVLAYVGSALGQLTRGPESAYFDSLTAFIALMVLGRWLQERLLERNRSSLLASDGVEGLTTRRFENGKLRAVAAATLEAGDEVWIAPGDLVPVEADLLGPSTASISLDWINGESRPQHVKPGDRIPAGAFNAGETSLRARSVAPFAESRLNELLRETPRPGGRDTVSGRWWHRVSTVYVSAVLALGVAGFLAWSSHGLERSLEVTIAILVVTCPCALGLATPLAHDLAHAALRRRGVFVKDASFLDRALAVRKIVFDKTGTLTRGRLALTERATKTLRELSASHREALGNLAARSNHPVSRCLTAALAENGDGVEVRADVAVRELAGAGLEWRDGDITYRLGRPSFAAAQNGSGNDEESAVFAANGRRLARFDFGEELHSDAVAEIGALHGAGYEIHLLSGDAADRVTRAAETLGIPPHRAGAALGPEEKAERVAALDERDTLMVGDGLNDRPSFDAAYAAATPAVEHASLPARSDVYFLGAGISAVRASLAVARRLRTVVRGNLVFAAGYNLVALSLCFAGVVTPLVAAVLMPLSSAGIVTFTAVRLSEGRLGWK